MKLSENQKFLIAIPLGLVLTFASVGIFVLCLLGLSYSLAVLVFWMFLL